MINLITVCRNRYSIPFQDLADAAETNRVRLIFTSILLFAAGVIDLIILTVLQLTRGVQKTAYFAYFGIFTVLSIYMFIHSICVKNVPREKAYAIKTIPFYVVLAGAIFAAVFNFYILEQPFNGVLIFSITGMIALSVFDFSVPPYAIIVCTGYVFLIPGVYKNYGLTGLLDLILTANLMCGLSLFKRHLEKRYLLLLQNQKKNLVAKTFGNFTLLFDNKVIKFSRSKSPELLAYLIYKNGSSVNTKELLTVLYGSHADSARYDELHDKLDSLVVRPTIVQGEDTKVAVWELDGDEATDRWVAEHPAGQAVKTEASAQAAAEAAAENVMDDEIVKTVISCTAEAYEVDESEITLQTDIREDLSNQSMKMIAMLAGIEEELDVTIEIPEAGNLNTIRDFVELARSRR